MRKKLQIVVLLSVILMSMFALPVFIKPAQAPLPPPSPVGSHKITAIYYQAYVYNDHDVGAGEWRFGLKSPVSGYSWTGKHIVDGARTVNFADRTMNWLISGNTWFRCRAEEWDGLFWLDWLDYYSQLTVTPITFPGTSVNTWHWGSYKTGDVRHYFKYYIRNLAPIVSSILGPSSGYRKTHSYTWTTTGSDPEGDSITAYKWYVDGVLKKVGSNSFTYTFPTSASVGNHQIKVRAKDYFNRYSSYKYKTFTINNRAPTVGAISGPTSGYTGIQYSYSTTGSDPDGDPITYQWQVNGVYQASTTSMMQYTFGTAGTYTVRVRTKDPIGFKGTYSSWSYKTTTIYKPATITITKVRMNKPIYKVGETMVIKAWVKKNGVPLTSGTVKAYILATGAGKPPVIVSIKTMTLVSAASGKWRATYGPIPDPSTPAGYEGRFQISVVALAGGGSATKSVYRFVAFRRFATAKLRWKWASSPSRVALGTNFDVKVTIKNKASTSQTLRVKLILPSGMTKVTGALTRDITLAAGASKFFKWTLKSTTPTNKLVKINVLKGGSVIAKLHWYIRDPS